jgi:glycosyltransferase involved in cell wall biosynthesis
VAHVNVYADLRWPPNTGIGVVQSALLSRAPSSLDLVDIGTAGRIGSPVSPLRIMRALALSGARRGVFWSAGYMPPARSEVPVVVTVHDLTHLHFYGSLHAAYYRLVLRRMYRQCRSIICVSEYTRGEFLEWSGVPSERVFTVHNGVSVDVFSGTGDYGLPYPYVFYPGNRRPYKNLQRLVRAYANSALPRSGIELVLTGEPDGELRRCAREAGVAESLHFCGSVNQQDLARLYRGAALVAFVSLYEGFGLPIVEAMAAGVPVLTSNVAAMPEVAGSAALLVDPTSTQEIASGLERISFDSDLRRQLVQRGREQAARFSWDDSAAAVWKIVAEACDDDR